MTALEHDHKPKRIALLDESGAPVLDDDGKPMSQWISGTAACPVCRVHDHTDTQPFALDRDMQEVPAFWFTCPRCGTAESQVHAHRWTEAGIAWMRDNSEFNGTFHLERLANTQEQAA